MKTIFILILFILAACNFFSDNVSDLPVKDEKVYTGLDINGNFRSCQKLSSNSACTAIYGPEDAFADECESNGDKAIACDCHDYICVDKNFNGEIKGIDINGEERSCSTIPLGKPCDEVFTPGDQYGVDCKNQGGNPFQCDCHDYICIF